MENKGKGEQLEKNKADSTTINRHLIRDGIVNWNRKSIVNGSPFRIS